MLGREAALRIPDLLLPLRETVGTERIAVDVHRLLATGPSPGVATVHGVRVIRPHLEHELLRIDSHALSMEGVTIVRGSNVALRPLVLHVEHAAHLALHIALRGTASARVDAAGATLPRIAGSAAILFLPRSLSTITLDEGVRNEALRVNLTLPYLRSLTDRYPELLEKAAARSAAGLPFRVDRPELMPMGDLLERVDELMRSEHYGSLRRIFLEAKIIELLVRCLQGPATLPARPRPLAARDVDRMVEARERLLGSMASPPTLAELARAVGTNEFKLKHDFKTVFKQPVYAFLLHHRLAHARRLILETDRAIKDIATEVGYVHVAHFSAAFRKTFGLPPGRLRKEGAESLLLSPLA
jgi:AraC family transcriptional activator of pyochelin receptor